MCDKFLWQISQIKYADKNLKVAQTIEFGKSATQQAGVKCYLEFYSAVNCYLNRT